jgi:hypothetical protein
MKSPEKTDEPLNIKFRPLLVRHGVVASQYVFGVLFGYHKAAQNENASKRNNYADHYLINYLYQPTCNSGLFNRELAPFHLLINTLPLQPKVLI